MKTFVGWLTRWPPWSFTSCVTQWRSSFTLISSFSIAFLLILISTENWLHFAWWLFALYLRISWVVRNSKSLSPLTRNNRRRKLQGKTSATFSLKRCIHFSLSSILYWKEYFAILFIDLSYRHVSFVYRRFFPLTHFASTAQFIYSVLDPNSLGMNHCGYSHVEVCNDPVQHLMGNSPDLRSNVTLERISSLEIVNKHPVS